MKTFSHYIFINKLSSVMKKNKALINGLNKFYKIKIPVSQEFYYKFKFTECKEVLLSKEFDNKLIIDFEKYFENSINLTLQSEINKENSNVLICQLEDIDCF